MRQLTARADGAHLEVRDLAGPGQSVTLAQPDATTCGATCVLAAWLLRAPVGQDWGGKADRGPQIAGIPGTADLPAFLGQRIKSLQTWMNRSAGGPLGPVPWTARLGSTPWALARELTRLGLAPSAYQVRWDHDHSPTWAQSVERVRAHLDAVSPVVLLVGGPLRPSGASCGRMRHLAAVLRRLPPIPRHYVLAIPPHALGRPAPGAGRAWVYDPASGVVTDLDLLGQWPAQGPGPAALGYWPRVLATVEPGRTP